MSQVLPGTSGGTGGQELMVEAPPEQQQQQQQAGAPQVKKIEGRSPFQLAMERFRKDKVAMGSLIFLIAISLLAIFAPVVVRLINHHPPNDGSHLYQMTNAFGSPKGPNAKLHFWFGADQFGRDLLSRVIYGARISLVVGVVATAFAMALGIVVGMVAGFFRGAIDSFLSRLMDILLSFPVLLFALALRAVFGASLWIIIFVIAFVTWPYIGRIVRGQVLSLREKEFVEASRSLGATDMRIIFRDILPNLLAPIIIYATLIIPSNILFEASLSYLGLGLPPPTATWGQMLSDAQEFYTVAWWMLVFPGAALLGTVMAFNLLGDGLRDALDPRGIS